MSDALNGALAALRRIGHLEGEVREARRERDRHLVALVDAGWGAAELARFLRAAGHRLTDATIRAAWKAAELDRERMVRQARQLERERGARTRGLR